MFAVPNHEALSLWFKQRVVREEFWSSGRSESVSAQLVYVYKLLIITRSLMLSCVRLDPALALVMHRAN